MRNFSRDIQKTHDKIIIAAPKKKFSRIEKMTKNIVYLDLKKMGNISINRR